MFFSGEPEHYDPSIHENVAQYFALIAPVYNVRAIMANWDKIEKIKQRWGNYVSINEINELLSFVPEITYKYNLKDEIESLNIDFVPVDVHHLANLLVQTWFNIFEIIELLNIFVYNPRAELASEIITKIDEKLPILNTINPDVAEWLKTVYKILSRKPIDKITDKEFELMLFDPLQPMVYEFIEKIREKGVNFKKIKQIWDE